MRVLKKAEDEADGPENEVETRMNSRTIKVAMITHPLACRSMVDIF